jgi:spermidine/putrescine-binding protein
MFTAALLSFVSFLSLTGAMCSPFMASHSLDSTIKMAKAARSGTVNLIIHNSDDYIANGKDGSMDIIKEFEDYCAKTDGVDVKVSYSTFGVMETELATIEQNTSHIDLVCVSDYIVQKLMKLNLVVPFATGEERKTLYGDHYSGWEDDYYAEYASKFLQNRLAAIKATINGEEKSVGDYARGYMWGTLGITYNPAFSTFGSKGLSKEDVMVQMSDWNALWNENYHGTFQVKDSMRDTYSIGLMHVYDSAFKTLLSWYQAGKDKAGNSYSESQYNADVSTIFNNINHIDDFNALMKKIDPEASTATAETVVDSVQSSLISLKNTSFGMEVDSGKTDIISGDKSGIDTAWSGDAITSMNGGDELTNPTTLYYSVPKTGGNIWFDSWVMLSSDTLEKEYAQKFIDFISKPSIAAANMDYIGYTSFVAGDDILSLVRGWYDPRTKAMYALDSDGYVIYDYTNNSDGDAVYLDGKGVHDVVIKDSDGKEQTYEGIDTGDVDMTGSDYSAPTLAGVKAADWSAYAKEKGWYSIDLSYFFQGTLKDLSDADMHFYSDEIEEVTGKNLAGQSETVLVGRQFLAQYPTEDEASKGTILCQIPGFAVMEDYGENNAYILRMWENVKSAGGIQVWIVVLFSVEVAAALGFGLYFFFKNRGSKVLRKRRREEMQASQPSAAVDPKHNAPKLR